jgi:hypothetical protein
MLPALIGAGASLLGGLVSSNAAKKDARRQEAFQRQQIAEMNAYNDPAQIRSRAEAAGFNPLLFIGPGVGQQSAVASAVSSGNFMGSALADAGMQIADQMSKNRELARLEKLSAENKKLAEKVQNLTIRPKMGGVYAQREATASLRAATGRTNASGTALSFGDLSSRSPLASVPVGADDGVRTGVQLAVTKDVPAFRLFGHDFYGSGLFSTGQQMEDAVGEGPLQWAYSPMVVADAGLNEAYKLGARTRARQDGTGPLMSIDGQSFIMEKYTPKSKRQPPDAKPRWNNSRPMFGGGF